MMKKHIYICLLLLFLTCVAFSITTFAHPGRTDSSGGHNDNENVSGLGYYHYHHGYPAHLHKNGDCPYDFDDETSSSNYINNLNNSNDNSLILNVLLCFVIGFILYIGFKRFNTFSNRAIDNLFDKKTNSVPKEGDIQMSNNNPPPNRNKIIKFNAPKAFLIILCIFIPCSIDASLRFIDFYISGLGTILLYGPFLFLISKIFKSSIGIKPKDTLIVAPLSESFEENDSDPNSVFPYETHDENYYLQQIHSLQQKFRICTLITITSLVLSICAIIISTTYTDKNNQKLSEIQDNLSDIQAKLSDMSLDMASHHVHIGLIEMSLNGIDLDYLEYRIKKIENYLNLY